MLTNPNLKSVTENQVKRQITDYLTAKRYDWYTIKSLGVYDAKIKRHRKDPYYKPGVSDLMVFHNGMFYAIELKRPVGGKQSDAQKSFEAVVKRHGFKYILATDVSDLIREGL